MLPHILFNPFVGVWNHRFLLLTTVTLIVLLLVPNTDRIPLAVLLAEVLLAILCVIFIHHLTLYVRETVFPCCYF